MRVAVAVLLLPLVASVAAAQLCLGNTNFSLSHFHSQVDVDIDHLAHRYAAEFRYRYRHFFTGLEYGLKSWDLTSLNGSSRAFGVTVGLTAQHPKSRFDLCPFVSYRSLAGPDEINGSLWNFDEKSYSAGVSMGYLAARTSLWDFMPTATLTIVTGNPRLTTVYGGSLPAYQDFCCGSQSLTLLRLGVGLGFTDELTLIPAVSLPLGDMGQKTYVIVATLRLGKGI
ncbi:MAG TPA: hypothetical protein VGJ80_13245 [Gemmatimonadales bacterium]|jgi:hypothetical protein